MPAENWKVVKHQDKYFITCHWNDHRYCTRYAYDTFDKADYAMIGFRNYFGQPISEQMDISANYYRFVASWNYEFATRTRPNQFATYILPPEKQIKRQRA